MKRCPECRRDYLDDSLLYCLEDGVALVQGSVPTHGEPPTAILLKPHAVSNAASSDEPMTAILSGPSTDGAELSTNSSGSSTNGGGSGSKRRLSRLLLALGMVVL